MSQALPQRLPPAFRMTLASLLLGCRRMRATLSPDLCDGAGQYNWPQVLIPLYHAPGVRLAASLFSERGNDDEEEERWQR